jgi:xylulokinase
MDLGIDIGTSEVKVVLVDDAGHVVGQAASALPISRPHALWSEQDPRDWWTATSPRRALPPQPKPTAPCAASASGQMHGACCSTPTACCARHRLTALHAEVRARTPCPASADTGNIAMPGLPHLLWVRKTNRDLQR